MSVPTLAELKSLSHTALLRTALNAAKEAERKQTLLDEAEAKIRTLLPVFYPADDTSATTECVTLDLNNPIQQQFVLDTLVNIGIIEDAHSPDIAKRLKAHSANNSSERKVPFEY